jgi:hypothetical protein
MSAEVAAKKMPGRECGRCSLCCKLLDVPEIGKPKDDWCQLCRPGHGGCSIYDHRPNVCRAYSCQWLSDSLLGDEWYPAKAKIVVDLQTAVTEGGVVRVLRFHVDPQHPNRWREEPYYSKIKTLARIGLEGSLFQTVVSIRGRWTLILPDQEIECDMLPGLKAGASQLLQP